jgi:hypothetical protein
MYLNAFETPPGGAEVPPDLKALLMVDFPTPKCPLSLVVGFCSGLKKSDRGEFSTLRHKMTSCFHTPLRCSLDERFERSVTGRSWRTWPLSVIPEVKGTPTPLLVLPTSCSPNVSLAPHVDLY